MVTHIDFWSIGNRSGTPSLYQTLKGFDEQGLKVLLLTYSKDGTDKTYSNNHNESFNNVEVLRFNLPIKSPFSPRSILSRLINKLRLLIFFIPMATFIASRYMRLNWVDIIYGYETHGVLVAWILNKLFKKPFVFRAMGVYNFPKTTMAMLRKLEMTLACKCPADLFIITDDGTDGANYIKKMNKKAANIAFWRNGVDKNSFTKYSEKQRQKCREKIGVRFDEKIILSLSVLHRVKGVHKIIKAMPEVLQKFPEAHLIITGDGSEKKNLENLASRLGISESIIFKGSIPREEVPIYLNAADLFVSMCDYANAVNPVYEAMLCGKCVIAENTGATSQLIVHMKNGILIEPDYEYSLVHTILSIIGNDSLLERIGNSARKFAIDNFWTWEERIKAEIEAISNVVEYYK